MAALWRTPDPPGWFLEFTQLTIRVQPRASSDAVLGFLEDGTLRMRVTAPPVDGAAKVAVCKVLSKALGVRRAAVRVRRGKTVRRKIVEVTGLAEADIRERLAG